MMEMNSHVTNRQTNRSTNNHHPNNFRSTNSLNNCSVYNQASRCMTTAQSNQHPNNRTSSTSTQTTRTPTRKARTNIDLNCTHYPSVAEAISNFQNIILEAEQELNQSLLDDEKSESIRSFEAKFDLPRLNSKITRRKSVNVVRYSKGRLDNSQNESRSTSRSSLSSNSRSFLSNYSRSNVSNNSRLNVSNQSRSIVSNNGRPIVSNSSRSIVSNNSRPDLSNQSRSNLSTQSRSNVLNNSRPDLSRSNLNHSCVKQSADSDDEKSKKKVLSSSIIEKRNKLSNQLNLDNANEHFTNLLRVRNEDTLIKLVKMHLLILLDLDGENFSNVFEEDSVSSKKTNTAKKKKQDSRSQEKGKNTVCSRSLGLVT